MLILKGNFIKDSLGRGLLAFLLAGLAALASGAGAAWAAPPGAPVRAAIRAPETVAAEFYGWYLETLAADQDPLSDRYERLSAYVARPLVEQLLQRLQAPRAGTSPAAPEHGDYFLQAERIEGAWLRSRVRAITVRQQARAAHVLVTLDGDEGAKYGLLLTMVLDNGAWKIRHVNRTSIDASESSPDRPVI